MKLITIEEHYMSKAINEKYMEVMTKTVSPAERARLQGFQGFLANSAISDLAEVRIATMDMRSLHWASPKDFLRSFPVQHA